jgi:hypothetical protein
MQPWIVLLLATSLAVATPALAQNAGVRRQVSTARVLSVTTTCFYGPSLDEAQALRLCRQQARGKLLDTAMAQFSAETVVARSALPTKERRAFVDSLLVVTPLAAESRQVPDGRAVRLTLRAEENPGKLADKLASFKANDQLRADALATTASRDRQAAEARMAAVPFGGDQEFDLPASPNVLSAATALATHRLVPGMSVASVKGLIGNPTVLHQAVIGADSYLCAGYDTLWVVFRDGLVSCLRTRLVYDPHRGTDCHCAGNYATILNTD